MDDAINEVISEIKIGKKRWAIAEGYIPASSHGEGADLVSHEALCILNANSETANVNLFIYFTDREPVGPYRIIISPRRSYHLRMNDLKDPEPIPSATEYSSVIESNVPIVVQLTRLDSRQSENALMTTIGYCED
ncbi:MAG: sensory rhodopsin transducer [Bdellovibrio sp.]